MNYPKTTKIIGITLHSLCFQSSGRKIFCTKSLQAMKSGFFMITLNAENHGLGLWSTFDIDAKAQYLRQGFALYLVGLERIVLYYELLQLGETITADATNDN